MIRGIGPVYAKKMIRARNWLLHGMGEVQGQAPIFEHPDDYFVPIESVAIRPSMGGGHVVEHEPEVGRSFGQSCASSRPRAPISRCSIVKLTRAMSR
jgi:hypothetical protein